MALRKVSQQSIHFSVQLSRSLRLGASGIFHRRSVAVDTENLRAATEKFWAYFVSSLLLLEPAREQTGQH